MRYHIKEGFRELVVFGSAAVGLSVVTWSAVAGAARGLLWLGHLFV